MVQENGEGMLSDAAQVLWIEKKVENSSIGGINFQTEQSGACEKMRGSLEDYVV